MGGGVGVKVITRTASAVKNYPGNTDVIVPSVPTVARVSVSASVTKIPIPGFIYNILFLQTLFVIIMKQIRLYLLQYFSAVYCFSSFQELIDLENLISITTCGLSELF